MSLSGCNSCGMGCLDYESAVNEFLLVSDLVERYTIFSLLIHKYSDFFSTY